MHHPRSPSTPSSLLFIWVSSLKPHFQMLSFNVKREIAQYLSYSSLGLICVTESGLTEIDPDSNTFRVICKDRIKLSSNQIAVRMSENRVFLFGGAGYSPAYQRTAYEVRDSDILKLPLLSAEKQYCGVAYYAVKDTIFLFGGLKPISLGRQKGVVKMNFRVGRWESVPNMPSGRVKFTPCVHNSTILLCACDGAGTVDIYSPDINSYRTINVVLPLEVAFTIFRKGTFWSYSEAVVTLWTLNSTETEAKELLQESPRWAPHPSNQVLIRNEKVYVLHAAFIQYYEVNGERICARNPTKWSSKA
jgi:hypothetical protein